jgi:glycosyltransferase involved in cell wall biosynthesis
MKIAHITAGAGHMYCGSCLRDNTLAAALRAAGHDVQLIPTYTPTRTDEPNVSYDRVFLGGINVVLQQHVALFRRTPWALDRLLDYPPLLRLATRWGVSVDPHQLGAMTVSMLQGLGGFQRKEIRKLVRYLADEVKPEIVTVPNSLLIGLVPAIKAELRVPVCCTLQGEELFLDSLAEPYKTRSIELVREHAAQVDAFVAMSHFGADQMAGYLAIDRGRIQVVPLGITLDGHAKRTGSDPVPFTIGYLARIAPEKGLHNLCEAYHRLVSRSTAALAPSRVWAAGYLAPEHRSYLAGVQKQMDDWGLSGQFHYHGELDRSAKLAYLRELSVLSVPGAYADPKGLFLLEAMASGVPIVQPRRGAATEVVETSGGGLLVAPEDPEALADGLLELLVDPAKRRTLGDRGYDGVRAHYSAAGMRDRALEVYRSLLAPAGSAGGRRPENDRA